MTETYRKALLALPMILVIGLSPVAYGHAGSVFDYWFKTDADMCYSESSLDNLDFGGSTGNGTGVIDVMELTRDMMNDEVNGVTFNEQGIFSCLATTVHIDVQSQDLASNVLGTEHSIQDFWDSEKVIQSEIRLNTDHDWSDNSNSCSTSDLDVQWIMNHEFGHSIGLKHHTHPSSPNSMMDETCVDKYEEFQSVDETAVDIHYS